MKKRTKIAALIAGASAAIDLANKGKHLYDVYTDWSHSRVPSHKFVTSIPQNDFLYAPVGSYVLSYMPKETPGNFTPVYNRGELSLAVVNTKDTVINYKGTMIEVSFSLTATAGRDENGWFEDSNVRQPEMTLTVNSKKELEVVREFIDEAYVAYNKREREPKIRFNRNGGYWSDGPILDKAKSLDKLIMEEGLQEKVIESIQRFLDGEDFYSKRGIPYHTGIALTGPPGTGKSSLISALAKHFQRDLYILNLSAYNGDSDLTTAINELGSDSILVIEDIDVQGVDLTRNGGSDGITLSSLLNMLDGIWTPHGLITIITSNNIEALDPALLRPGRIDHIFELDYADTSQLDRLCDLFYGQPSGLEVNSDISTAEITNALRQSSSLEDGLLEIKEIMKERESYGSGTKFGY